MSAAEPDVVTVSERTVWEWRLQRPSEEPEEAQEGLRAALEGAVAQLAARDSVVAAEHCERDGCFEVALTLREGTPDSWAWQVRDCTQLLESIGGLSVVESGSRALKRVERQPAPSKLLCAGSEMSSLDARDSRLEAALLARIDALVQQHAQSGGNRSSTLAQIMDELKSSRHTHPEFTGTEALDALAESQSIGQAETQLHGSALRLIGNRLSSAESRCKLAIESTLDASPIHVLSPARSDRDRLMRCNELLTHAVEEIESCRHLCTQFTDFMVACADAKGEEGAAAEERTAEAEAPRRETLREAEAATQAEAVALATAAQLRGSEGTAEDEAEKAGGGDAEVAEPQGEEGAEEAQGEEGDQEGEAAEAREKAVVRLQSARRGSLARQEAQLLRVQQQQEAAEAREKAVVRLQSARRGSLARQEAQLLRVQQQEAAEAREKAAVLIQATRRGSLAKREVQLLREQRQAAEEAPEPGEEAATAKEGQWYVVAQETLDIWESSQSWESIGSLSQGDFVQAAGPTEQAEGIVMLPILLEGGSGAVEFGCLELHVEEAEGEGEGQGEQEGGAETAEAVAEAEQEKGAADQAELAIVPAEDNEKQDGPMDARQLEALMSTASKSRLAKKDNVDEGISVTTCPLVLKPFDDGNKKWKCSNESPDCTRMVEGPKARWSCPQGEYNLCRGCVQFYRKKAIVAKFDKNKKPWDACSVRDAEGCGLPLAVVVKDAKEEFLNGTLLLSSTKDSMEERGAYVYGAFAERTDGNWPYMWFDAKALKWKFSSWQKAQVKAPSFALCRAEIQSVKVGAVLGDWTLSKGPKTILPMTVNAMTDEEIWESEAREMVPLDLTDVISVVSNTAANLLEEDLHLDTPFMESGFTSAMAVQYRMILNSELAVNLPATLMFDHPNMRSIGHYIVDLSKS